MARLAFIVSHPIQYYAPLYQRLARRADIQLKVFFTWHGGEKAYPDHGFGKRVSWDIPLTEGYDYEVVPNTAKKPGPQSFWGLQNPGLISKVLTWKPDSVLITGYSFASHLQAIRSLPSHGVSVLFRGDSHLLDGNGSQWHWQLKRLLLRKIYRWPTAFLCVGKANKNYYRAFDVPETKLFDCPHSIELARFVEPHNELEQKARQWRAEIGVRNGQKVALFAGKFEDKKQPLPLMRAFLKATMNDVIMLMVGDGAHGQQVRELAAQHPEKFRVLPFQNQSKMPLVYRLGDLLALPSGYQETWGLAVNEAMACGRPALVSDRVGCHPDVIRPGETGEIFAAGDWHSFHEGLKRMILIDWSFRRNELQKFAKNWSIERTEEALIGALRQLQLRAQIKCP